MATPTTKLEGAPTWGRGRRIGHYGGALDKHDSRTEGRVPYAWVFYIELRAARGSTYSALVDKQGLVHAECLAFARSEAGRLRAANKVRFSAVPATSGDKLDSWVIRLGVDVYPDDTRHDVRARCIAHFQAAAGPTQRNVDESVEELLGDAVFVRAWRQEGTDLASPPAQTYWPNPTGDPLVATYKLTDETWLSERAHYVVEVEQPATMSLTEYRRLLDVKLYALLDRMLPVWATFDWAEDLSGDGFTLDLADLDYTGIGT